MKEILLVLLALIFIDGLTFIYAMILRDRLDALEKNFHEATLGCYDEEA